MSYWDDWQRYRYYSESISSYVYEEEVESISSVAEEIDYCADSHLKMMYFRNSGRYCDINVRVRDDKIFPCHRLVLASVSEYFDALFSSDFIDRHTEEATLYDIDSDTFEEILQSIYTGQRCKITTSNVYHLLRASSFLVIRPIENDCIAFLRDIKPPSMQDHVQLFRLANLLNISDLVEVLSTYIVENFKSFYCDEGFLGMPIDDLQVIVGKWREVQRPLKHDILFLDLIVRWIHQIPGDRQKFYEKLIEIINFDRISPEYLTFMVKYFKNPMEIVGFPDMYRAFDVIREETSNYDLPEGYYCFNIHDSQNRGLLKSEMTEYYITNERFAGDMEDVTPVPLSRLKSCKGELSLHVYVEYTQQHQARSSVVGVRSEHPIVEECYERATILSMHKYEPDWFVSGETNAWYQCIKRRTVVPEPHTVMFCLETYGGDGASMPQNYTQTFCTYSSVDMRSARQILNPPPRNVVEYDMCAVRNNIYLEEYLEIDREGHEPWDRHRSFSQLELDPRFFRYNCEVDKWFPVPRSRMGMCHLATDNNFLYSINNYKVVRVLDERAAGWIDMPPTKNDQNIFLRSHPLTSSCALNGKLYICNGYDIEYFDARAREWSTLETPFFPVRTRSSEMWLSNWRLVPYENMLWTIGGCPLLGLEGNYYCTTTYDLASHEWYTSTLLDETMEELRPAGRESAEDSVVWEMKDIVVFRNN